jgi:hypothetical protein
MAPQVSTHRKLGFNNRGTKKILITFRDIATRSDLNSASSPGPAAY